MGGDEQPTMPSVQTAAAPSAARSDQVSATAPTGESDARIGFSTRYAYFQPADWAQLPGWGDDRLVDAWAAFRRTCAAMGRKTAWSAPCGRARAVGQGDGEAVRRFFESEFTLYEIRNPDRTPDGVITGYYEPLISGNRRKGGGFVYPVYATPDDLLTLDVRDIPRELRGSPVAARIAGRKVIPVLDGKAPYVIDVGAIQPDVRDKKLRVRLDGTRVVPYPTRAEIERDGLPRARVLAWVDNPAAFYSMQIQGSGKVHLPDGRIVRLAYAEQNGHPFKPPVSKGGAGSKKVRVTTRGLSIELPEGEEDPQDEVPLPTDEEVSDNEPLTRGAKSASSGRSASRAEAERAFPSGNGVLSPEVERLVEELATGRPVGGRPVGERPSPKPPRPVSVPPSSGSAAAKDQRPATESVSSGGRTNVPDTAPATSETVSAVPMVFPQPSEAMRAAISADPSYVFFREIPDGPDGPIGALGVPLTAGRSVAVDPRTTPLGYPVFISTTRPGRQGRLNRLVIAQDTGGAIRGAVRADYFWGFGAEAYSQAARMKENGRMWLLLPRGQEIAARDQALRTRGGGAGGSAMECVIPDPDLCVEDP
jgi:membrane-bound lytic murein transglycosylase A